MPINQLVVWSDSGFTLLWKNICYIYNLFDAKRCVGGSVTRQSPPRIWVWFESNRRNVFWRATVLPMARSTRSAVAKIPFPAGLQLFFSNPSDAHQHFYRQGMTYLSNTTSQRSESNHQWWGLFKKINAIVNYCNI